MLAKEGLRGKRLPYAQDTLNIFAAANAQRRAYNRDVIASEFLLLGALEIPSIRQQFEDLGASPDAIKASIQGVIGEKTLSGMPATLDGLAFNPRGQRVLDVADSYAKEEGATHLAAKHILHALVVVDGMAAYALEQNGITKEKFPKPTQSVNMQAIKAHSELEQTRSSWPNQIEEPIMVRLKKLMSPQGGLNENMRGILTTTLQKLAGGGTIEEFLTKDPGALRKVLEEIELRAKLGEL